MRASISRLMWLLMAAAASEAGAQEPVGLRLIANEYSYELPDSVSAGLVRVRLVNRGREPHYARIVRLGGGHNAEDLGGLLRAGARPPTWLQPVGGIAPVMPGDSADLLLSLVAGSYAVYCSYPDPTGVPHIRHGMLRGFVVNALGTGNQELSAPATVAVTDFSFAPSVLQAGRRAIQVHNHGTATHQVLLIRLPDRVTAADEMAWFRAPSRSARPGRPNGGILEILPGQRASFTVDLTAGRYLLLCGIATPDGVRHFDLGMVHELTVVD